ncbi:DUF1643 domain-containing protein [Metasolibacillus meyeri]|uniref:DUF1643 domain-containing protein n=1 Tax=Metasolibacillus meyeri TaxID=1071052 RepID=A0AAW9NUA4_9BACL|nr:DUF1643 domain-containing protein [Metasolibacillus meyeri]MEC1178398.1 DUF1643 domain-containing protein [Metasolibacillus meyeri]
MVVTMEFDAVFDDFENPTFRYSLTRNWNKDLPKATIIMLNPSIANILKNDLSINRCLNFCIDHNYGALEVVNLFAFIETDSNKLSAKPEFIGAENDNYIRMATESAETIIVAWGSDKEYRTRKRHVWMQLLDEKKVYYFEDNSNRTPPVHISRLAKGFYLKEYVPMF